MIPLDESPPSPVQVAVQIYQFHVLLLTISPAIWRRFLIRSDSTIADLHYSLQILMGWDDEHLHQFTIHGKWWLLSTGSTLSFRLIGCPVLGAHYKLPVV